MENICVSYMELEVCIKARWNALHRKRLTSILWRLSLEDWPWREEKLNDEKCCKKKYVYIEICMYVRT